MEVTKYQILKDGTLLTDHPEPLEPDEKISFEADSTSTFTLSLQLSDQLQDNQADTMCNAADSGSACCGNCATCENQDGCSNKH